MIVFGNSSIVQSPIERVKHYKRTYISTQESFWLSFIDGLIGCLGSSQGFKSVVFIVQLSFDLEQSSFSS